jgi:tetratricopeptide (TPR) repeat protein
VHDLLAAAEALGAMGEFEQATALIEPKMAYFEHNAALRQLRAQIAMLQGDPKRSAELYAEARMLEPDDVSLQEEMLWAQYAAGYYSQCYETATAMQVKAAQPRTDLTHLQARCLAMMGRGVEARELYLQLVKTRSAEASYWSELGTLCWELGDYRNLAQSSVQMMAIAPDRYEGYLFRAVNERHKGNTAEAQRLLKEACKRAGGVTLPFLMLGQSLEQSGDRAGAALAYNQALQADPDSAEARALLGRLNGDQQISAAPDQ